MGLRRPRGADDDGDPRRCARLDGLQGTGAGWRERRGGAARADRVIDRIERVDGDVAIFSHGHFLRVLAARWLGLPPVDGRLLMLDPATLCVLGTEHETRAIRVWNGAPRREGG